MKKVMKTYSGLRGCMCGCQGKWSYTKEGAELMNPGYSVTDKINERSVKIISKKVLTNPNVVYSECGEYAFVDTPTRTSVVYFERG